MKNFKALTLAILLAVFSSSYALAEFAIGISGAIADIEASGTETEGGEKTSADVDNQAGVFSVFAEYSPGFVSGLSIGIDYIPGTADVSNEVKKRTDTESSVTGDADETTTSRAQTAQAEIEDHLTLYANYNILDGVYLKLGFVQVDVNTTESLATGSKYGNVSLDGILYGIGAQTDVGSSGFMRFELTTTDYDDIAITSSEARAGVSTNNKITADLDVTMLKASYGYKF